MIPGKGNNGMVNSVLEFEDDVAENDAKVLRKIKHNRESIIDGDNSYLDDIKDVYMARRIIVSLLKDYDEVYGIAERSISLVKEFSSSVSAVTDSIQRQVGGKNGEAGIDCRL